jgi:phosphatidylglycerophosphate synthase
VTALVVLVDRAASTGGPAALLETAPGRTVLVGLLEAMAKFGVRPTAVLTRTAWRDQVAAVLPSAVPVMAFSDTAGALGLLAVHLDSLSGPVAGPGQSGGQSPPSVVVAHGDLVAHSGALGDLVADPRLATAILTHHQGPADLEVSGGSVRAAGSAHHPLTTGNRTHAGVMRIGSADRPQLVVAARDLCGIATVAGWDADLAELLAVGALQRGVAIREVAVGEYVFDRPGDPAGASVAMRRLAENDEHRIRLRRVARPDDGFYSTFVIRRISPRVTDLAVRMGWTPNSVTLGALAIAVLAAWCFATGTRLGLVAGALLLQVSLVVDCVDGETARYTRTFSALGAWLDATTDRVKEYLVYAALAAGASRSGHDVWTLACTTLALQVFRNFVDFGFVATLGQRGSPGVEDSGVASVGRGAVALSARTSATAALKWAKRMVFLPIGERWLIISVCAAFSGARAVFLVLLGLGVVSAVYATTGRVLRTFAAGAPRPDEAVSGRDGEIDQLVDVGGVSRASARRLPPVGRPAALGLAAVAAALTAVVAGSGDRVPTALGLVAVVVLAAPAWREPPGGAFGWLLPAVARGLEYGLVVRVVAEFDRAAMPLVFSALCAVAYHHYDTVYRWRHTRSGPAGWVFRAGLGWDGRLLLLALNLLVSARLGPLLGLESVGLGAAFVLESARAWTAWFRAQNPAVTRSA